HVLFYGNKDGIVLTDRRQRETVIADFHHNGISDAWCIVSRDIYRLPVRKVRERTVLRRADIRSRSHSGILRVVVVIQKVQVYRIEAYPGSNPVADNDQIVDRFKHYESHGRFTLRM